MTTERESSSKCLDRSRLKPLDAEEFPSNYMVRTDKPCGLVANENGLIGFENTNLIVRIRATENACPPHGGPLSILFVHGGQETCEIDGRRFVLDDSSYLIHNCGQTVSSWIKSSTCVESFTIAFWPGFASEVLRSLITPDDHLLDSPRPPCPQPVRFFDQLYPHDEILSPLLVKLRHALEHATPTLGWLEEHHHLLLARMLQVHRQVGKEMERLPAVRAATRMELYQRLHRARDFMESGLEQPLTIPQIAEEAWFSPHHFLRQFKQAFGETPHQYLTRRRLERAQQLLRTTDLRVTDICSMVGFESLGSFSWLFRQRLGRSPEQFRLNHRQFMVSLAAPVAEHESSNSSREDERRYHS